MNFITGCTGGISGGDCLTVVLLPQGRRYPVLKQRHLLATRVIKNQPPKQTPFVVAGSEKSRS